MAFSKGGQVVFDHSMYGLGIDLAQVIMGQDVAKTANLLPGNQWMLLFQIIGQLLGRLGERLQVTQGGVIQHFVPQ